MLMLTARSAVRVSSPSSTPGEGDFLRAHVLRRPGQTFGQHVLRFELKSQMRWRAASAARPRAPPDRLL